MGRGALGGAATLVCAAVGLTGLIAPAAAKTIHVRAKKNDAIAKALANRADPGDRLVLHKGVYRDPVVVDKRVRIVGRKKGRKPVLDFGCAAHTGVDVTAPGVTLRRLKLRGGEYFTLDISEVSSGRARQLRLIDECNAEYGINVFDAGAVEILKTRASGYIDAGIYVGLITDTSPGPLVIRANEGFANNRGLIVEFSAGVDMRIVDNHFHHNTLSGVGSEAGIFVNDSDGVLFEDNLVEDNGLYGIEFTSNSDFNRLFRNIMRRNPTNVFNPGGNCGADNSPDVFPDC